MDVEILCPICKQMFEASVESDSSKVLEMDGDYFNVPYECDCGNKGYLKIELNWS